MDQRKGRGEWEGALKERQMLGMAVVMGERSNKDGSMGRAKHSV